MCGDIEFRRRENEAMMSEDEVFGTDEELVEQVAARALDLGITVAVAESLTGGWISTRLGSGASASEWYHGAVVAYHQSVKFDVLGVTPGPVVSDACAREMARGVCRALKADVGLGVTGVGGPGEEEGKPVGTVYLAVSNRQRMTSREFHVEGDATDIIAKVTSTALGELARALSG